MPPTSIKKFAVKLLPILLFTLDVLAGSATVNAQTARVFDLGAQGSSAIAINNNGQVLTVGGTYNNLHHYVIGKFETIDIPGNNLGFSDINDVGQVAGGITNIPCAFNLRPTIAHFALYSIATGTLTDLGTYNNPEYGGCTSVSASMLNNNGLIVGEGDGGPVIYSGGVVNAVEVYPGSSTTRFFDVNDSGQIVGQHFNNYFSYVPHYPSRALLYHNGTYTDLGVQPGFYVSAAYDINNAGDIVGTSEIIEPRVIHPFLLRNGVWTDLGVLPGAVGCYGNKINNTGQVAATCVLSNGSAVTAIYNNGVWTDINSLLPAGSGWQIGAVKDYNDQGVILAQASINGAQHYVLVDPNPDTTPPRVTIPGTFAVAAESSSGSLVWFNASGVDEYSTPAGVDCDHPSGSVFPIGSTVVTCRAVDPTGNMSAQQSFAVQVVDTAPNLSLPGDVVTNATSADGAQVTYFASADDAVSGPLAAQCSPTSGSTFPVGLTTVNCSATDGAGNTAAGSFNVYVLTADQPFTPPDGYYVTVQPANGPTITFAYVDGAGVTTVTPIDAATVGTTPAGFALSNGIAYQISTTASFYDYVQLDFAVPGPISESDFNNLSILHNNNGTLEDVTAGRSYDPQSQSGIITAYTYSFSPFYLAKKVGLRVSPLFDQTQAFKAGSTIPLKLQLLNEAGANVSSQATQVKARNLVRLGTGTTSTVIDAGNANPDLNFRYIGGSYVFNLNTTGLTPGAYALSFYVGSDRSFFYTVKFEIK